LAKCNQWLKETNQMQSKIAAAWQQGRLSQEQREKLVELVAAFRTRVSRFRDQVVQPAGRRVAELAGNQHDEGAKA
jgi:hypothetical protein